jgi:serralysin
MVASTTQTPYLVPTNSNVAFNSILSVGDIVGTKSDGTPWKMVGIPDGLGAYDNGDGTMTVLMNHEIGATAGVVRDHGSKGAFVSKLVIDKTTFEVKSADDLIQTVHLYNSTTGLYEEKMTAFARFCSADLPAVNAFFDPKTGLGTAERIFMNGEETGPEGRSFANVVTGVDAGSSFELPRLGKFSYENSVANAFSGAKTVVVGTDDATPGEVYVYIGDKQSSGSTIEKAGLTNGKLFGIQANFGDDTASTPTTGTFTLVEQGVNGDVSSLTGAQLNAAGANLTQFGRPEDSSWDPSNPNRLYIATTGTPATSLSPGIPTRIFAVDFIDVEHPELGGNISIVLEGAVAQSNPATGPVMIDNITVTEAGVLVLQEDPGNNARLAKVWIYDPKLDNGVDAFSGLTELAQHDPARFSNPFGPTATPAPFGANGFGQDEESSGVIDVTKLMGSDKLTFLLDTQAHYSITGELVEGGQLMAMTVDLPNPGDTKFKGTGGADIFDGGFGNDELYGNNGDDTLFGSYGDDQVIGGSGNDMLDGGVGNDVLKGGDGIDTLDGGVGEDNLDGGNGADTLDGGVGDDKLQGGEGDDILKGNFGNDKIVGGAGDDQLSGNQGDDTLQGDAGDDHIYGGQGDDKISGLADNDFLFGGAGNDQIDGGDGNDALDGGLGDDKMNGRDGTDVLNGGARKDDMTGGTGTDTFVFSMASDSMIGNEDLIRDFVTGVDKIDLSAMDLSLVAAFDGHANQLTQLNLYGSTYALLADINGDSVADFKVVLMNSGALAGSDFIL